MMDVSFFLFVCFRIIGRDEVQQEREKLTFAHFTYNFFSHFLSLTHIKTMHTKKNERLKRTS